MNIAICDDEENIRCLIRKLIERQEGSFHIMEFSSGGALLQFWQQEGRERIDILFLDISMDGIDGMKVAEQIRAWKEEREEPLWGSLPLLIFVSGYSEYMPKAFSVNAFQYLMKPLDEREFEAVFAKALRECRYLETKRKRNRGGYRSAAERSPEMFLSMIFFILRAETGRSSSGCGRRK